jgi:DNA-binding NtrC family response regulator
MDENNNEPYATQDWIGQSAPLKQMKQELQLLADSNLPVLITGQRGTGKGIAAYTIHRHKHSIDSKPFIVINCQQWRNTSAVDHMTEAWQQAKGGTLLLRNIDALVPQEAERIKDFWLSSVSGQLNVRLLASVGEINQLPAQRFHINQSFVDWLHYHCLNVELKPLSQRMADISSLLTHFGQQDQRIAQLEFNGAGYCALKNYSWPGNVKQFKRCLDKLTILQSGKLITEQVLLSHFPAMNRQRIVLSASINGAVNTNKLSQLTQLNGAKSLSRITGDKRPLLNDDCSNEGRCAQYLKEVHAAKSNGMEEQMRLTGHHPALDKAIKYICNNYKSAFSMSDLASSACVSPSHLSFLFKRYLGQSFKQILLTLRIDEAVRLLNTHPHRQVTHICDDVGFSDLSFFERKFKTMVGVSPGVYRDQYGQSYRPQ